MQRCQQLFVRQEYDDCLALMENMSDQATAANEVLLCTKGLIYRQQGHVLQSLGEFQRAAALNPVSPTAAKQVAHNLLLLSRYEEALNKYGELQALHPGDWELLHHTGLCYAGLGELNKAAALFRQALDMQPHDVTHVQLIKTHMQLNNVQEALRTGIEALQGSPENSELLSLVGLAYLQKGETYRAFDLLGSALVHCPRDTRTILAAGRIIQDHADYDVALVKYRVAAVHAPNSPQLWNNIGMCLLGKQKHVAAISCLKKALYLGPFEWMICHNLGLAHLCTHQPASAFHYFSAAVNLQPSHAQSYMGMGLALAHLDDLDNACHAFDKAIQLGGDVVIHLNYAVVLYTHGEADAARQHYLQAEELMKAHPDGLQHSEAQVMECRQQLKQLLEG